MKVKVRILVEGFYDNEKFSLEMDEQCVLRLVESIEKTVVPSLKQGASFGTFSCGLFEVQTDWDGNCGCRNEQWACPEGKRLWEECSSDEGLIQYRAHVLTYGEANGSTRN